MHTGAARRKDVCFRRQSGHWPLVWKIPIADRKTSGMIPKLRETFILPNERSIRSLANKRTWFAIHSKSIWATHRISLRLRTYEHRCFFIRAPGTWLSTNHKMPGASRVDDQRFRRRTRSSNQAEGKQEQTGDKPNHWNKDRNDKTGSFQFFSTFEKNQGQVNRREDA